MLITTYASYSVRFSLDEVPITGVKTGGVKGINLKDEDYVVSVNADSYRKQTKISCLITIRGAVKKMALNEIEAGGTS